MRRSAATPCFTEIVIPGRLIERFVPHADDGRSCAFTKDSMTCLGDRTQSSVEASTGTSHTTPLSGSLNMPLANDVEARLGLPGHARTDGSRMLRPSREPSRQ